MKAFTHIDNNWYPRDLNQSELLPAVETSWTGDLIFVSPKAMIGTGILFWSTSSWSETMLFMDDKSRIWSTSTSVSPDDILVSGWRYPDSAFFEFFLENEKQFVPLFNLFDKLD